MCRLEEFCPKKKNLLGRGKMKPKLCDWGKWNSPLPPPTHHSALHVFHIQGSVSSNL